MNDVVIFKAKRLDNSEWVTGMSIVVFVDNGVLSAYMPEENSDCVAVHDEDGNIDSIEGKLYEVDYESLELYKGGFVEVDCEKDISLS